MEKRTIPVVGMSCSACAASVERRLRSVEGVTSVSVSLAGRTALVEYDPSVVTLRRMSDEVARIGYSLVVDDELGAEQMERMARRRAMRRAVLAWVFVVINMAVCMGWVVVGGREAIDQTCLIVAALSMVLCGRQFYVNAVRQLTARTAGMDALIALSTAVAFAFSAFNTFWGESFWGSRGMQWHTYFDAPVMIIAFVLTGRLIEERAKGGAASAIRGLMGLVPPVAHVVVEGEASDVPVATLSPGDVVEVGRGDKVPVDGTVTGGTAYIDESMITGEPVAVKRQRGQRVLAGTVVKEGTLRLRATGVGRDTVVASIINTVREAQSSKAPVQRIADRVAAVFVPCVVLISLLTLLIWLFVGGMAALPRAVMSAVSVLVISCPCAMGLATPTALMVGMGKAAQKNILIKDAATLENMRRTDVAVLDKTGTLTIPSATVPSVSPEQLKPWEKESLKPHAEEAVSSLKEMGVQVWMLSGDAPEAVDYWAERAGIEHRKSRLSPQDKEDIVRRLQGEGHCVAMVGDGINDSQALAVADVSIAMGRGTDIAMDVAHVTLIGDDLRRIVDAVDLSRRTVSMIRQNLFWAFVYNIVCIPLAAGLPAVFGADFVVTPALASALMAFSSVSVVLNSLRLKLVR